MCPTPSPKLGSGYPKVTDTGELGSGKPLLNSSSVKSGRHGRQGSLSSLGQSLGGPVGRAEGEGDRGEVYDRVRGITEGSDGVEGCGVGAYW